MKKHELIFDERYVGSVAVNHVSKFYGEDMEVKALDNLSLQLFTGQFVVILGAWKWKIYAFKCYWWNGYCFGWRD